MSMQDSIIKNRVSKLIKRHLPADRHVQLNMKTEECWTEAATRRFIDNLVMRDEQWREIITRKNQTSNFAEINTVSIEKTVCKILHHTETAPCTDQDFPAEKTISIRNNNNNYRFAKANALGVKNISEVMLFTNHTAAHNFLLKIIPRQRKLVAIVKELGITLPASGFTTTAATLAALTDELVSGNVVILIEKSTMATTVNNLSQK